MDIAKLQRVNQLARELKGFGMAESMDDAYNQADSLVDGGSELSFLKHLEDPVQPEVQEETLEVQQQSSDTNLKAQFLHLSSLYREQEAKMNNMADIMMKMQHAMNDLFSEIRELKDKKPEVVVKEAPKVAEQPRQPAQSVKKEETSHPRSGGYSADEVAVDKIFYCGNK